MLNMLFSKEIFYHLKDSEIKTVGFNYLFFPEEEKLKSKILISLFSPLKGEKSDIL